MLNKTLSVTLALLLIAEIGFISYAFPPFRDGLESKDWPTTTGTILTSYISYREEFTNNEDRPSYSAQVTYEFEVKGISYKSNKLHVTNIGKLRFWDGDLSKEQKIVDKYLPGNKVTVYYSEDNPNNCALEPGLHFGNYFMFVLSIIFLLIYALLFYVFQPRLIIHSKSN